MRGAGDVVLSLLEAWAARRTAVEPSRLMLGDCFERMREIPDGSVDMVLCDLPYGTTQNKWDTVLPLDRLWAEYWRVCRGAVVLTAAQPFTSVLVCSQLQKFKYQLVWDKVLPRGHLNAKRQPMRVHEDVCVFGTGVYNPQMSSGHKRKIARTRYVSSGSNYGGEKRDTFYDSEERYPQSILTFSTADQRDKLHPTQKPVPLFEYLVRTYTNVGATVLDNCMGSGTTGVACANSGRRFVGIERDEGYFAVAERRIREAEGTARERGGVLK